MSDQLGAFFAPDSPLSTLSEVELLCHEKAVEVKLGSYKPQAASDDTVKLLESFVKYLPHEGRDNMIWFISEHCDDAKLKVLADHLWTIIIVPCEFFCSNALSTN